MSSTPPHEPPSKKRKLRKGTRSCWECKRRKSRCIYSKPTDTTCLGCRQRGTGCISQEDEDAAAEAFENGTIKVSDRRLRRIEQMLETLVQGRNSGDASNLQTAREENSESTVDTPGRDPANITVRAPQPTLLPCDLDVTLAETLHSLLPSAEECERLCASALLVPCFFHQLLTRDYLALSLLGCSQRAAQQLIKLPSQGAHPVLIAQKMLMLACLTQYSPELSSGAGMKARGEEMARSAIEVVTTKDDLVRNAEGLECLMLEATWHLNNGHLRRAFGAVRRAIATAQLLGIHRSLHRNVHQVDDQAPQFDPSYMWSRITYVDRLLCLILGLPKGSPDIIVPSVAEALALTPEQRLERAHCAIASRILDRGEHDADDINVAQTIDALLQDTATTLPADWWLAPSLATIDSPRDMFLSTTRLVNQLLHFNLVNQTHLPHLLKPDPVEDPSLYWYSKAACVTASREILHRYLALEFSGFVAHAYHFVDFFTLIAAITLLLAHLDNHWQHDSHTLNVLSHMRSSDRATIRQVATHMGKPPTCKGPAMLAQLLAIEEEAFCCRTVASGKIMKDDLDSAPFFKLNLPYYGQLRVNSVKICFKRALEIEDLTSSIEMLSPSECPNNDGSRNLDDTLFVDWLNVGSEAGTTQDPYGGTEMAFLDSFQGFLQNTL